MGIDLANRFSSVAFMSLNGVEFVSDGRWMGIPFTVHCDEDRVVCRSYAEEMGPTTADRIVYDSKRMLGKRYDDVESLAPLISQ